MLRPVTSCASSPRDALGRRRTRKQASDRHRTSVPNTCRGCPQLQAGVQFENKGEVNEWRYRVKRREVPDWGRRIARSPQSRQDKQRRPPLAASGFPGGYRLARIAERYYQMAVAVGNYQPRELLTIHDFLPSGPAQQAASRWKLCRIGNVTGGRPPARITARRVMTFTRSAVTRAALHARSPRRSRVWRPRHRPNP